MIPGIEPVNFRVVVCTNCATVCLKTHSQFIYTEIKLVPCILAFVTIFIDKEYMCLNERNCHVFLCNVVCYAVGMCRCKHSKSSEFCQVAYRMSDITQAQTLCLWRPVTFACSLFIQTDVWILDSIWRYKGKHECLGKKNLWACRPRHCLVSRVS